MLKGEHILEDEITNFEKLDFQTNISPIDQQSAFAIKKTAKLLISYLTTT